MVYSQICSWLDDVIGEDPPEELLDVWDLTEWLHESEIIDMFKNIIIPTYKNKKSRDDAENILHALLWEYFLFRRDSAIAVLTRDPDTVARIKALPCSEQQSPEWHSEKNSLLTASEFAGILDSNRVSIIRSKLRTNFNVNQTVFLSYEEKIPPVAWGFRYEPVIRALYEKVTDCKILSVGRVRHRVLKQLAASPDGLIESGPNAGRLLEIKAPVSRSLEEDIVPYDYYCQMQVQMEVFDIGSVDYCECRLKAVNSWAGVEKNGPLWIGALVVIGFLDDAASWEYVYSPLFPNTDEGRADLSSWSPSGNVLEIQMWTIEDWQLLTVVRNKRWWNTVGLPEYERFIKDLSKARQDPMFLSPDDDFKSKPMFLDD